MTSHGPADAPQSGWLPLLNLSPDQRLVILHADDVGMCHSAVSAFQELTEAGGVFSGSVMAPCPWFPAVAEYCAANPQVDMGVHLTLTSEWKSYRWGPVSTRDRSSGLIDSGGFLHHKRDAVTRFARPSAVRDEMRAQIDRALTAGLDVTHIDAHMFTCLWPSYLADYIALAREYRVPVLVWRPIWDVVDFPPDEAADGPAILREAEAAGLIPIDHVIMLDSTQPERRLEQAFRAIDQLPAGVTHFLIHPAEDTPELRAITPTGWRNRVADYEAFRDPRLQAHIHASSIRVIGYRELRTALRSRGSSACASA